MIIFWMKCFNCLELQLDNVVQFIDNVYDESFGKKVTNKLGVKKEKFR